MEDASNAISSELSLNKRNALNMNGIVFLKGDSCGFIGSLRWIFLLYFCSYTVHSRVVKTVVSQRFSEEHQLLRLEIRI